MKVGDLHGELVPRAALLIQTTLGVIQLRLQRRLGLAERRVGAVHVLKLSLQLEVLLRQARLHSAQLLHLARQVVHLRLQTPHLVVEALNLGLGVGTRFGRGVQ